MDDKAPTVTAAAGMSGNNQPVVCIKESLPFDTTQVTSPQNGNNPKWGDPCHPLAAQGHPPTVICKHQYLFENHSQDTRYKGPLDVSPMLPAQLGTGGNNTPFVVEERPGPKTPIVFDKEVYNSGVNASGGHYIAEGGPSPALRTEHPPGVAIRYIVRRLTPTECARLQGFADRWGDIDQKDSFTLEEHEFWLGVRNTHAAINGRAVKDYTEAQMVSWYNKLHTDSAEYKMWGNGIALPPALYCMQGIAESMEG